MSSVRIATADDIDAIVPLFDAYRQFYECAPNAALAREFMAERLRAADSVVLLAQSTSGATLGFCQLYPSFCSLAAARIFVLYDLYVAPGARGQGVGRDLLRQAERYAQSVGAVRLDLSTAKTNIPAQALYGAEAWSRDETFHVYSKRIEAQEPGRPLS